MNNVVASGKDKLNIWGESKPIITLIYFVFRNRNGVSILMANLSFGMTMVTPGPGSVQKASSIKKPPMDLNIFCVFVSVEIDSLSMLLLYSLIELVCARMRS